MRGFPTWNLDASVVKDIGVMEGWTGWCDAQLSVHEPAEPFPALEPQSLNYQFDHLWAHYGPEQTRPETWRWACASTF